MTGNRVNGFMLTPKSRRIAGVDQPSRRNAGDITGQLVRGQYELGARIATELRRLRGFSAGLEHAASREPGRQSTVEQTHSFMTEPSQHPPGPRRNCTVGTIIDDHIGVVAYAQSSQRRSNRCYVGQRMTSRLRADRRGEILIEIQEDRTRDMRLLVAATPCGGIGKIESCVDDGNTRLTNQWLEFGDGYQDRILSHCYLDHGIGAVRPCTQHCASRQYHHAAGIARAVPERAGSQIVDKILVGLKRVVDYNVRVQVKSDGSGVETDGVKMSINPFDEIALEEALRIKERGEANEVIAVSIGTSDSQQQLRTGLAMGADRAILVTADGYLDPLSVARIFHSLAEKENAGLVMLGKQAIDGDNSQIPQMLSALWGRPQATFASSVTLNGESARIVREVDAGLETIDVDLPAVISVDLRLNEARYVKLPDIMKAKKKPLDEVALADLGIEAGPPIKELSFAPPEGRQRGIMVGDVAGLVAAIKDKGLA